MSRHAGLAVLALAAAALTADLWTPSTPIDDAFISYRYAANWLAGEGLVFNPGERVEGITNLLWVVCIAGAGLLGVAPPAAGHALGLLSALACLALAYALARALAPRAPPAFAATAPVLVAAAVSFAIWARSGLETCFFAAWIAAGFLAAARGRRGLALAALMAATATRPEGGLAAAAWLAVEWLEGRRPWRPALVFGLFLALLTLGRLAYYGDALPNTFYAKVAGWLPGRGLLYLAAFLSDGWIFLLPGLAVAALRLPRARPAALFCVGLAAWVVAIGGDALGYSRFLVPLIPLLAALAAAAAASAVTRVGAASLGASLVAAILCLTFFSVPRFDARKRAHFLEQAEAGARLHERLARERVKTLRARGETGATLATGAIGAIGYYSGAPIVDILGLVDRHVARAELSDRRVPGHSRSDADYVLARRPDYVLIRRIGDGRGSLGAVRDLWAHPDLTRHYAWDPAMRGYRRLRPVAAAGAARGSDVVMILVDTLRADQLGSYGAARETSPALDALAAEGVRFAAASAAAPWTTASVGSMLTGLWPASHGADRVRAKLADEQVTLAERLRAEGYHTEAVVSHSALGSSVGFDQGFEHYDEAEARGHYAITGAAVTRRALARLERLRADPAPFFLLVHYFDPHYQYRRREGIDFAAPRVGRLDGSESIAHLRDLSPPPDPEELGFLLDLYDEEIRATDAEIGVLLDALRADDRWQRTLVVFTADHGEEFFEHGWLGHTRHLYQEELHVPLILRGPGAPPGRNVRAPVSLAGLTPSLLDLLGIPFAEEDFDAPSWLPVLAGHMPPDAPIYAEVDFEAPIDLRKMAHGRALRRGRWKLIRNDLADTVELYDLRRDPHERTDRAADEPFRVAHLLAELERLEARRRSHPARTDREISDEEAERLRALGYTR